MPTWTDWFHAALAKYPSPQAYYEDYKAYHAPIYDAIQGVRPPPARLIEVGAGIGFSAVALNARGYLVTALEPDRTVVDLAVSLSDAWAAVRWYPYTLQQAMTAADLDRPYDVATCLGVLEHYDRPERVHMLGQLATLAPLVVVSIPSPFQLRINPPTQGEQAIPMRELVEECDEAGLDVTQYFGWGQVPNEHGLLSFCVLGERASG